MLEEFVHDNKGWVTVNDFGEITSYSNLVAALLHLNRARQHLSMSATSESSPAKAPRAPSSAY